MNMKEPGMKRYEKHLALPGITPAHQDFLKSAKLLMVGAGGLGAAALPYLAGAGIGHIAVADADSVDISNLHRQTIFKDSEAGENKARLAASYIKSLNPGIAAAAIPRHVTAENAPRICAGFDIILDGTDNFESKTLLNEISMELKTPLISASVEGFKGTVAIFAGFTADAPCYHCLFPELPGDCKSCTEAGILGTVAGLAGLYQAHMALCFLLGLEGIGPGAVLSLDFKTMRTQMLGLQKNPGCPACKNALYQEKKPAAPAPDIPFIRFANLKDHLIVDVRTDDEVAAEPIENALHMPLDTIPDRFTELPADRPLAFACATVIRSRRAAEYLYARGYKNVCVLDRRAA